MVLKFIYKFIYNIPNLLTTNWKEGWSLYYFPFKTYHFFGNSLFNYEGSFCTYIKLHFYVWPFIWNYMKWKRKWQGPYLAIKTFKTSQHPKYYSPVIIVLITSRNLKKTYFGNGFCCCLSDSGLLFKQKKRWFCTSIYFIKAESK